MSFTKGTLYFSFRLSRTMAVVSSLAGIGDDCELLPSVQSVLAKKENFIR